MKELKANPDKSIINTHFPIAKRLPTKRWIIAQARPEKHRVDQNNCTEAAYHRVIDAVKTLYLKPNEIYYDRDLKTDKTEGSLGMHSFITPTFYFTLFCEFTYTYAVEYAFYNCPFEAEIRKMMQAYPLDRQAKPRELHPDFTTYYQTVLRIQDTAFLHSL